MCFTIEVYSWKRLHIITVTLYPNSGYMDGERKIWGQSELLSYNTEIQWKIFVSNSGDQLKNQRTIFMWKGWPLFGDLRP